MKKRPRPKILVLGFDGLSWEVVDSLVARGELSNMKAVLDKGSSWVLKSTVPPLTPAAWGTIFSGLAPSEHGVFDFTSRDRGTYHFRLTKAADRRGEMIWSLASRGDRCRLARERSPHALRARFLTWLSPKGGEEDRNHR